MSDRLEQLHTWICKSLGINDYKLQPASADASFRRYFRLQDGLQSFIVMDAPPERERCEPFIDIANRLLATGVNVPEILEVDAGNGFILLSDLGSSLYLDRLNKLFEFLQETALTQPRVFVHRDYHSRNLMICEEHNPGILDFQDAVIGPVTYDLVSLLKDCYIKWPREKVNAWALDFYYQLDQTEIDETGFLRQFDLMGVQRHLKASGIFARLYHRDKKSGFLQDIPRTLSYIVDLETDNPELGFLIELLTTEVIPVMTEVNNKCTP